MASQKSCLEFHEDLLVMAQQQGLKGKKLNKAIENFAWNIRVLKGQADLTTQAANDCKEYLMQVCNWLDLCCQ